ncbi:MAG: outer membrane beta-barrel protein [Deltaproteobacteria bacterium]|nr:outer membrane beta-barrel protein [Candidatus Deferrimicrobium borealis]
MSHDRFLKPAGWVTIAMAILSPAGALGYDFRLVPSLAAREGYNSNLYFTPQDRVDSWVTRVAPGLDVSGRTERLDAAAGGNLIWWWYSADSNLNTVDYDARGRAAYRFTDTFRASATGEYRKESSPDRIFEDTGVVQNFQVDYRQDYTASAEVALSEKAAATLSYAYQQVEYPDRPFQDFTYHTADLGFAYNLSRFATETKGRLDLGFGRGLYEGLTVNNYTATVGVFRAVHELWSARVGIGGRYTTSTFDVLGQRQESTDWGWVGDASVIYTGERTNASFTFSNDIAPAYGYAGAVLRTSGVLNLSRRFLHELSGTLLAGYYRNKSEAGQYSFRSIDEQSTRLRPGIRWEATKNIVLDASYQYTWLEYQLTGEKVVQNVVYASATLSYPFFDE